MTILLFVGQVVSRPERTSITDGWRDGREERKYYYRYVGVFLNVIPATVSFFSISDVNNCLTFIAF